MPDPEKRGGELMVTCAYARGAGGATTAGYQARAAASAGSCQCESHCHPNLPPKASDSPPALVVLLEYIHARTSGNPAALVALLEAAAAGSDMLPPVAIGSSKGQQPGPNYLPLPAARGATAAGGVPPEFLLPLAVKNNYLDCVRELLTLGANVEAVDEIGLTPLLVATRAGNVSAIGILIDLGSADVNSSGQTVWTALHFAAHGGDPATIEALVTRGAELSARTTLKGKSPLHIAAGHAQTRAVQELVLRWGADETQLDGRGRSASDIVGVLKNVFDRGDGHAEEVERIKVMLANAPADRRWNRRRDVVMLVSRLRGKIARERSLQETSSSSSAVKKRGSGVDATEVAAAAVLLDPAVLVVGNDGVGGRGADVELLAGESAAVTVGEQQASAPVGMETFRDAVTRLAGEDDIGVFRSVVSFL
ncbi:unnamed protein product [Ectocarpus sp. 4 AP-2014]